MEDLYIIELIDRIKIGQTTNLEQRLKDITYTGGISPKEIRKCFHFPKCGKFEQILLKLTKDETIIGEWRTRNTPMITYFIDYLYLNNKVDREVVERLATLSQLSKQKRIHFRNEWFFTIASYIYAERKGIGQSLRGKIRYDIHEKSITYKNWKYEITGNREAPFIRLPKFSLENMTVVHKRECLKIIRNRIKQKIPCLSTKYMEIILNYLYDRGSVKNSLLDSDIRSLIIFTFFAETLNDDNTKIENFDDKELKEHVHLLASAHLFSCLTKNNKLEYLDQIQSIVKKQHGESNFHLNKIELLKRYLNQEIENPLFELFLQNLIVNYIFPENDSYFFTETDWELWSNFVSEEA